MAVIVLVWVKLAVGSIVLVGVIVNVFVSVDVRVGELVNVGDQVGVLVSVTAKAAWPSNKKAVSRRFITAQSKV